MAYDVRLHCKPILFDFDRTNANLYPVRVGKGSAESATGGCQDGSDPRHLLMLEKPDSLEISHPATFNVPEIHNVVHVLHRVHLAPRNGDFNDYGKCFE
jgi:hypothetical protein